MAFHAQLLADTIRNPVSSELLAHVSNEAGRVIPCHTAEEDQDDTMPSLPAFITLLAKRSSVRAGTLLGALVYLDRLQQRLAPIAKGMSCTCHRIFLATLIVTSKSLHDTSPKNKHWTRYAIYFKLPEVNLMEKQLLSLLNYRVIITLDDLYRVFAKYEASLGTPRLPALRHFPINQYDNDKKTLPIVLPPPPLHRSRPCLAPLQPSFGKPGQNSLIGTNMYSTVASHLAPLQSTSSNSLSSSLTSDSSISLLSNVSTINSSSSSLSSNSSSSLADGSSIVLPPTSFLATTEITAANKKFYAMPSEKGLYPSTHVHYKTLFSPSLSSSSWHGPLE